MASLLDHALSYAYRGWPVLPLRGKLPITAHGLRDASTDPDRIVRWWREYPEANVGVRCLACYVLDVDPRHQGDVRLGALAQVHGLPRGPLVRTGSGGYHLYYQPLELAEGESLRRHPVEGCDGCGPGHYVVAPPSVHPDTGQPYRWVRRIEDPLPVMPDWLRERAVRSPEPERPPSDPLTGNVVERARRYVATMPVAIAGQGGHDAAWAVACKLVHGFELSDVSALGLLREYSARCQPPWTEREIAHKLASARRDAGALARPVEERRRTSRT